MKNYGHIIYENNTWIIKELEPHAAIRLKHLFKKISITARPPFIFQNTLDVCKDLDWFMMRYPLIISGEDKLKLESRILLYEKKLGECEEILSNDYTPDKPLVLKNDQKLRDYQEQAAALTVKNNFLLLGDDLGLGKTLSGIGTILRSKGLPCFIVVPTHLVSHWREKIKEFTWLETHTIKGRKPYSLPKADVFIVKYSCLSGWIDVFDILNYQTVIFDEMHYLRRSDSDRYRAAKVLASNSTYKMGLTATPIFNYGDEIYNILEVLNPGGLGVLSDFLREWAGDKNRIKNPRALGTFLRDNYMFLRRTPEEVGRELPVVNKIVQKVGFDSKMVKKKEEIMKQLAMAVISGTFTEKGQAARRLDMEMRYLTGVSKARYVAGYVKILLENNRPVLLAGWHRDCYEIWKEEFSLYNPVFYTGSEVGKQKDESFRKFIEGESNLMIISLRSGEGLDGLQFKCKDIVFGELDWSPAIHNQVIGRLHRDGQTNQVTAHYLVSDGGSDPLLIDLLGVKSSEARQIVDPLAGPAKVLNDDSRMKLLAQKVLEG